MGLNEIERWLNILMLQELSTDKPEELIKISIIRSRFAQTLAKRALMIYTAQHSAGMMGLFSVLDGVLEKSMAAALSGIALPPSILEALIDGSGSLYPIYELMAAYEKGDWGTTLRRSQELSIEVYLVSR
jgi:EAL and modified HD-GYP domain-containing signal transduction protein